MKSPFFAIRSVSLGLLAAVLTVAPAYAASINYGNYVGTSVTYSNVSESSGTDGLPLFGAPTIFGNTLSFDPVFTASASGALGIDHTDGQLNMGISAHAGNVIPTFSFTEFGDFDLSGPLSSNTYVRVSALFTIRIWAVDGNNLLSPLYINGSMTFAPSTPSNGKFDHGAYDGSFFWSGNYTLDVMSALTTAGIPYINGATYMTLALDNKLTAVSEDGTTAFIAKKIADGVTLTVPQIPEPSILALTLCGAGLLFARRRMVR